MNKSRAFLYAIVGVPIGLLIIPTIIVLSVALIPTGVAFLVERGKGYYGGLTVGALNLAGTSPYLADLWFDGHTVDAAIDIITNIFAWLMFYGAAVFGWAIYSTTPAIISAFMTMTAGNRISSLRATQRELVQTWGPDVEYVHEPDKVAAEKAAAAKGPAAKPAPAKPAGAKPTPAKPASLGDAD